MEFRTEVKIDRPAWRIEPCERILFVGSCFADSIGRRFREEGFPAVANPYGTMYNPASVMHTVERYLQETADVAAEKPDICFITLGTNHIYILKETGGIVDNCCKRPQCLFEERELTVEECADYLKKTVAMLVERNPAIHIVLTVSPIRYRKYGYHESRISKAVLLLATDVLQKTFGIRHSALDVAISYFPAYEILEDELRDYRFYSPDMIHPSEQAVEFIWERLTESYFSDHARRYLDEWKPIKEAMGHRPFNAEGEEYRLFVRKTKEKIAAFSQKYPNFALPAEGRHFLEDR